ncbi:MAG: hypothetical protein WC868_13065 [Bacteroidales bacterium]
MKKILFITVTVLLLYSSCKTDFEINAEWKDITVVYGLLNQKDSIHYIKINKAFLGDGNALTMATNPDSCTYPPGILDVWVEEWKNNSQSNSWNLDTTTVYNKEPGVFYNPKQVLYKFTAQLDTLDGNTEYRLYIRNKQTGKVISSKTPLVHNFSITKPSPYQLAVFNNSNSIPVKWSTAQNGKLYQVDIRFNYLEDSSGIISSKYIDWNIGVVKADGPVGTEMTTNYYGDSFFKFLGDNIPHSNNVIRHIGIPNVEFIFSVAADDFNTYMEVSAPSTGINQEKPEYTNITNGIGIFSSRFSIDRPLNMAGQSKDSLFNGVYTQDLNFQP